MPGLLRQKEWLMIKQLIAPRDLGAIPALAVTAFVVFAIFGWTERTEIADPDGLSVHYWPWKFWQIANGYSDLFGDNSGDVWRTINPLFLGSASVAGVALWSHGSIEARVGAVLSLAMGLALFTNAYFVNNADFWPILNPARVLTELAWVALASQGNTISNENG